MSKNGRFSIHLTFLLLREYLTESTWFRCNQRWSIFRSFRRRRVLIFTRIPHQKHLFKWSEEVHPLDGGLVLYSERNVTDFHSFGSFIIQPTTEARNCLESSFFSISSDSSCDPLIIFRPLKIAQCLTSLRSACHFFHRYPAGGLVNYLCWNFLATSSVQSVSLQQLELRVEWSNIFALVSSGVGR